MESQNPDHPSTPQVIDKRARGLVGAWLCSWGAFGISVGGWSGLALFGFSLVGVYAVSAGKFPKWRGKLENGNLMWSILGGTGTAALGFAIVEMALR